MYEGLSMQTFLKFVLSCDYIFPSVMAIAIKSEVVLENAMARKLLKALSDPLRLQIIESLSGGERCVCDLINEIGLAQSKISFHLKVLKDAGLITDRQTGRWVYYQLNIDSLNSLQAWIELLKESSQQPSQACK